MVDLHDRLQALAKLKMDIIRTRNRLRVKYKELALIFGMTPSDLSRFLNNKEKGISAERLLKMEYWVDKNRNG